MKTNLLSAVLMIISLAASSQTILYEENFESYPVGSYMGIVNPEWWTTWGGNPGTGEDCVVSDSYADSGSQSMFITWEDGITDALLLLGDKTSGIYELDWDMYVESGYGAYYNLQHFEEPGVESAFEIYFYSDNTGELRVGNQSYLFNYESNNWIEVNHIFNLDEDQATLKINDVEILTWPFHYKTWDTDGTNQLGAIDFNDNTGYRSFLDNIEYEELSTTGISVPPAGEPVSISVYPNPANEYLNISADKEITRLELFDQAGRSVYRNSDPNSTVRVDLSSIQSGIYFLQAFTLSGVSRQKLIVQ